MKKITKLLVVFLFIISFGININAKEPVTLHFFYGNGCPHCAKEEKELISKLENRKDVVVIKYEVWENKENAELLNKIIKAYNIKGGVPFNVIGDTVVVGYNETNKQKIIDAIDYYQNNEYNDQIDKILSSQKVVINDTFSQYTKEDKIIETPFFGKINLKNLSLIFATIVIGLVDGFNPCAMWILLFLISSLIGMKDKKKMLILGSTFLLTSGLVYFIIMFSWLNIVINVSTSNLFRNIIAIFALGAGIYNIYNFYKNLKDDGCNVVDKNKRKDVFSKIKKFTNEKRMIFAIAGMILLAISVNIVELLCSAGLPVVYSELLVMNKVNNFQAIFYNLIYIFFFMLDDFVVFLLAIKTMEVTGFSSKYSKYSHLIGGSIMIIIGILLLIKPGLLMFGI